MEKGVYLVCRDEERAKLLFETVCGGTLTRERLVKNMQKNESSKNEQLKNE